MTAKARCVKHRDGWCATATGARMTSRINGRCHPCQGRAGQTTDRRDSRKDD